MTFLRRAPPLTLACVVLLGAACGPSAPPAASAPTREDAKLHDGPLTDYVPAAGLRWLAVARLDDLAAAPQLRPSLELLFPAERLDSFSKGSGIDLRETPEALAAGFDYATVFAARTDRVSVPEENFAKRLVTDPKVTSPHPGLRVIGGLVGSTPETLVSMDRRWVLVSVGSATPAKVAILFATGRLKKTVPALNGAALKGFPDAVEAAPLRIYAPGPFQGEWLNAGGGLLAAATAVALTVEPVDPHDVKLTLRIAGQWDLEDRPRLLSAWGQLAEDPLGRLLALNEPVETPRVSSTLEMLTLEVRLRAEPLARGLRAAVMAEIDEILGLPARSKSESDFENLDVRKRD
ncbi:MAG: hypothetical protein R3B13_05135 [Polyangiaceae bacterium]